MMEALDEDVGMASVAMESLITEEAIITALREMLPSMDANTVTIGVVMEKLALRFGTDRKEVKSRWRARLKELLPDMLDLCAGGDEDENEAEEEEVDLRPSRKRTTRKRNAVSDSEDEEEDDANDSDASETKADQPEDDEDEEVTPAKRKLPSSGVSRKRTSKPPTKKVKTAKQPDTPGVASLKELGRAAGILNPRMYGLLKAASSAEEEEEILRERLRDADVSFSGSFPSSRDISVAKRKHEKAKELEGIDTSLIISGGRSRRNTAPRVSYREDRLSEEDKDAIEEDEDDDDDEDASDREAVESGSDSEGTF